MKWLRTSALIITITLKRPITVIRNKNFPFIVIEIWLFANKVTRLYSNVQCTTETPSIVFTFKKKKNVWSSLQLINSNDVDWAIFSVPISHFSIISRCRENFCIFNRGLHIRRRLCIESHFHIWVHKWVGLLQHIRPYLRVGQR